MKKKSKILSLTNKNTLREITQDGIGKTSNESIRDVSISANGTLWAIMLDPNASEKDAGGGPVKYKGPTDKKWKSIESGGAIKIDGGPKGSKAYIINNKGEVWQLEIEKKPIQLSGEGFAKEISAGADGTVWVISQEGTHGGASIQYLKDDQWIRVPSELGAIKISGTPKGEALIINSDGIVSTIDKNGLAEQMTGENFAKEISIDPDGVIWIVSNDPHEDGGNKVSYQIKSGEAWQDVDGGATILDAGFA
ncbi:hypothetical protein QYS49_34075 [Marivirga salinae]|uniref:Uncharacterized protein n=1 Tax=Marivirga salinarum TaxID=3059078 RepID=A0AA51NCC8_9BACT|nr:hypothetical protein [Marivirga sp. BDSF4-3]WMN12612.1 hypothetical protein QYS49_34075 [Marivirga sp. BDSF4-3]